MSAASWSWSRSAQLAAGAGAAVIWILGLEWVHFEYLILFAANDKHPPELDGPFGLPFDWWDNLPFVAGVLGLIAILGAFRRNRAVAVVLGLGTIYLVAWLIDPPHVFQGQGASDTTYRWPAYAATATVAVAAVVSALSPRER